MDSPVWFEIFCFVTKFSTERVHDSILHTGRSSPVNTFLNFRTSGKLAVTRIHPPYKMKQISNVIKICLANTYTKLEQQISKRKPIRRNDFNIEPKSTSTEVTFSTFYFVQTDDYYDGIVYVYEDGQLEYRPNSNPYNSEPTFLISDMNTVAVLGSEQSNWTKSYDRLGGRTPDEDTFADLFVIQPHGGTPNHVVLENKDTHHLSSVVLDVAAYSECLKSRLQLTER